MAKATNELQPKHAPSKPTRRQMMGIGAAGMLAPCVVVGVPKSAAASPLIAEPSARGRAVLALIADQRAAMAEQGKHDAAGDKAGAAKWERRWTAIAARIELQAAKIMAGRITSLSDIADRAIVAAYDCDAAGGDLVPREDGEMIGRLIADLLAMSGVSPREANFGI